MDIFDQYIFEELTEQYAKSEPSEDYEELYQRFCNIDYLPEVKPYLLTMRFFGLGIAPEKDATLNELKNSLSENNYILNGLYYDLLLSQNEHDAEALSCLLDMVKKGYTNIFTKEKSFLGKIALEKPDKERDDSINIKINSGYISNWINPASERVVLSDPYILFTDRVITSITDILSLLEAIIQENVPLLVIAKDVNGEALETLKVNCQRHTLISICIKVTAENDAELLRILNDAAITCQGTVISELQGSILPEATTNMLGRATSVIIDKNTTSITIGTEVQTKQEQSTENVIVDYITFECGNYNGLYFTAGDVDYLNAKVFIKPFRGKKHIKVRSQIFLDNNAFSKAFSNEYDIDSSTRWFKTQGWGNTNFNCYSNNIYKWVIEVDGKTTFSQEFRMYNGKLNKIGPNVRAIKLFASKSSGALEEDRNKYKTAFDGNSLEYVYFKFLIEPPGEAMNIQIFIKITNLENNTIFRDKYFLQQLNGNTIACWNGIGFSKAGNWEKGLYQYSVCIGMGARYEGTFTVY